MLSIKRERLDEPRGCTDGSLAVASKTWSDPLREQELAIRTLLGAKGIATRNKDATRGSWPY